MLVEGQKYFVEWDGVEHYECIARKFSEGIYIGNQAVSHGCWFSETIESNEPFFIYTNELGNYSYIKGLENGATHHMAIYGMTPEIKKIDAKFLPELNLPINIRGYHQNVTLFCNNEQFACYDYSSSDNDFSVLT